MVKLYAKKDTVRKYYKYVYEEATTPVFTSQFEAEQGKNGVKIITTPSYYTITGTSTAVLNNNNTLTFDLGEGSKDIATLGYIGVVSFNNYPATVLTNIQGSTDNQVWETISSSYGGRGDYKTNPLSIPTPNNYRYIRFTTACDDSYYSMGGAYGLVIGYTARYYIEVSTQDDYDFFIDKIIPSMPKINNKYYASTQGR